MGKVRSQITDPTKALAQWVYRKLSNHDPMSAIAKMQRAGRDKENPLFAEGTDGAVLYPLSNGEVFMVTVTRLTPAQIASQRRALGKHYVQA